MDGSRLVPNRENLTVLENKGLIGEKRVAERIKQICPGLSVLYVGGQQMQQINGISFYSADLLCWGCNTSLWIQVKHKDPRKMYPDTGLELWRFESLKRLYRASGIPVLVLFTDEKGENSAIRIYGEFHPSLSKIESPYGARHNSKTGDEMIYFELSKLRPDHELLKEYFYEGFIEGGEWNI